MGSIKWDLPFSNVGIKICVKFDSHPDELESLILSHS